MTVHRQPPHNLPPRFCERLIGRDAELDDIKHRLSLRSRDGVIAIEGIRGVGKTALALEAAWRCVGEDSGRLREQEGFEAVIWASARREQLTQNGIVPDMPTLSNLDDLFVAMDRVLNLQVLARASRKERWKTARRALENTRRVLLVVDNVDDVSDPDLMVFLGELPQGHKGIVTLRFHEDMPDPIELAPLDQHSARELVRSEFDAHARGLDGAQLESISAATHGLPLAARLVVGLSETIGPDPALVRLRDQHGDLTRYVFGDLVDSLQANDTLAYHALLACAFFDEGAPISIDALAATMAMDGTNCRRALAHLRRLNLLSGGEGGAYRMLPIIHDYVEQRISSHGEWEKGARRRWLSFYEHLAARLDQPATYEAHRFEAAYVDRAMRWLVQQEPDPESMSRLAALYTRTQEFLFAEGRWPALEVAGDLLAHRAATGALTPETTLALLQARIDIFCRRGDVDGGRRWLEPIEATIERMHDPLARAELMLARARLLCNDGSLTVTLLIPPPMQRRQYLLRQYLLQLVDEAEPGLLDALATFKRVQRPDKVAQVYLTHGHLLRARAILRDTGDPPAHDALTRAQAEDYRLVKRDYEHALSLLQSDRARGNGRAQAMQDIVRASLALVAGRLGDHQTAYRELRAVVRDLVEQSDRAEVYAAMAYYAYWTGRRDEASEARAKANHLKERLLLDTDRDLCYEELLWKKEIGAL